MSETEKRQRIETWGLPAVFFCALALYVFCLAPGVWWGDGADFVLSGHYLGVAHPTGYPLITLLVKLSIALGVGNPAFCVGLATAAAGAVAATVFFRVAYRLCGSATISAYATAVLTVSTFLWFQCEIIEIYSFNLFFCLCMIALSVPFAGGGIKNLIFLVLVACIGLGNHGTLIFPALLLGIIGLFSSRKKFFPALFLSVMFVALGFTLYACLPLFSARTGLFDWNSPVSPKRFFTLLSGLDFWVIGEYKPDVMAENAKFLGLSILKQANVLLLMGFAAAVYTIRKKIDKKLLLLGIFLLAGFFPILYPTKEKEAFFLISYTAYLLLGAVGLSVFLAPEMKMGVRRAASLIILAAGTVHIAWLLNANAPAMTFTGDETPEIYSRLLLKSARRDAIIFIDHVADDAVAPPLYFQFAMGRRRDVFLFHRLFLAFDWYRENMRDRAAWTGDDISVPEIDFEAEKLKNYKVNLEEYERLKEGKTLNTISIDLQTVKIWDANLERRPQYINTTARFAKSVQSEGVSIFHEGFLFRLGGEYPGCLGIEMKKNEVGEAQPVTINPQRKFASKSACYKYSGSISPVPEASEVDVVYNALMYDHYVESARLFNSWRDLASTVSALENALEYKKTTWILGTLSDALKALGDEKGSLKYQELYESERAKEYDIH